MDNLYCILYRNTTNGSVGAVLGEDDEIVIFDTGNEACEAADDVGVCQVYPYQIVELDELEFGED